MILPTDELAVAARLGIAALAGLAVGVERERAGRATGAAARFAGIRTFLLLGVLGGAAGLLLASTAPFAGVVLLAAGGAFVVAAYVVVARRPGGDAGGTTEGAALVVLSLGALAGLGHLAIVGGTAALVVLALSQKEQLHWMVGRIGETELRAALQFAVLALVVLPLLPEGPYGPLGGVRPRALWTVVLLFSGLSFAGYIARRVVGPGRGQALAGLLGGLVSSTAVTLQLSRQSRDEPALAGPLALGVVSACTVLLPRVAIVAAILQPSLAMALVPFLLPPAAVGAVAVAVTLLRTDGGDGARGEGPKSPLRLLSAMQMALVFQLVLMGVVLMQDVWGASGVIASAAVVGLTDVDAITLAMSRMAASSEAVSLAARAVAVAVLSNTLLKCVLAFGLGGPAFRRAVVPGLLALAGASVLGLWIGG